MTMLSKEQKDLLLLFQCIIDTGAEVLREFTEPRLTTGFKDFTEMLEKKKHYFFHQKNKKRLHCCECPLTGCIIQFNGDLDKKLFEKMYVYDSTITIPRGHHTNNGTVQQICLCRFQVTTISINDFDLSNLNYLILNLRLLYLHESNLIDALKIIMKVRENVMHAVSSECYSSYKLVNLWNDFETAILQFAPTNSSFLVKKLIAKAKKELLSEEDFNSLMSKASEERVKIADEYATLTCHVEDSGVRVKNHMTNELNTALKKVNAAMQQSESNIRGAINQNHIVLAGRLENIEVMLSTFLKSIHVTSEGREHGPDEGSKRGPNEGSERGPAEGSKRGPEDGGKHEPEEGREHGLPYEDIGHGPEGGSKNGTEKGNEHGPENGTAHGPQKESESDQRQINVKMTADSLTEQAEADVINNLPTDKERESKDTEVDDVNGNLSKDRLRIVSKRRKCIFLELIASPRVFTNTETLRSAILELVREVLIAGKINTNIKDTIYVEMSFGTSLTKSEYDVVLDLLSSQPYTEHVEPDTDDLMQNQPEYTYVDTCKVCIDKSEEITRLGKQIVRQERQIKQQNDNLGQQIDQMKDNIDQQKYNIEQQKQQIKQMKENTEQQKQQIKQQSQQIEKQKEQIEQQSKEIYGQQIDQLKGVQEEKMKAHAVGKISDEPLQRKEKLKEDKSFHSFVIKSGKGYTLLDQGILFHDAYGKDQAAGLHNVHETKKPQYNIECGQVIICCENESTYTRQYYLKRIQESFVKFPNITVQVRERCSIEDADIEIMKSKADCLILICVDVLGSLDWFTHHRYESSLFKIPIVTIAECNHQMKQEIVLGSMYRGERLVVTSLQGSSRYRIIPGNSILDYLLFALENMKDGDDFASILYDASKQINQQRTDDISDFGSSREDMSVFASSLRKKLVLK